MKLLCIDAKYTGKVELGKDVFAHLEKNNYHTIALFASVQFVQHLPSVQKQLTKYQTTISRASRTHVEGQLLGCDVYENTLNLTGDVDCFLYIGDGFFHPKALLFAQKEKKKEDFKEVLMFDPIGKTFRVFTHKDNHKVMGKLKANLSTLLRAENIGFIATIKPGQSFVHLSQKLQEKYPEKKVYTFVTDNIAESVLESFPFIEVWINSACPRLGFDDAAEIQKPIVNIVDALGAEEILTKL